MKVPSDNTRRLANPQSTLARVLRFRNRRIIDKFLERYRLPRREAEVLFRDMLMFLWLGSHKAIHIFPAQVLIDEMWHTFILHTKEYDLFCRRFFGRMIHHTPTPRPKKRGPRSSAETRSALRLRRRTISAVYDCLGSDVAERWYATYAERYTRSFVNEHTRVKPSP